MSDNGRKKIELPMSITVRELAQRTESSPIQVIKILMSNGVMANINQQIDFDTAAIVVSELGFEAVPESLVEEEK
ncbi:MAG: translation initiation factor IF-2 N-terminal domain-containing protein, partial [Anaerolinea sp.]